MNTHADKTQENKKQSLSNAVAKKKIGGESTFRFVDNRPETIAQRKLQEMANNRETSQDMQSQNKPESDNEVAQLVHYTSGEPIYMKDDDPTSELIDDNFDDTIKENLTQPTADDAIKAAVTAKSNIDVILWRSTTGASVAAIQAAGSAGGAIAQADVAAPGYEVQQEQIAVGGVVPEYTASQEVTGFSWRHWLVVVRINTRYLAKGSGSESGWIASPAAPVEVLDTVNRTMGLPEPAGVGAA